MSVASRDGRARRRPFAVIAGGGTGGHVYPALAIADALVANGHPKDALHFVGSKRALEAQVVPEAGYRITLLSGRGIKRKLSTDNLAAVAGLCWAFLRAKALLLRRRPQVVISVGGYAAAPAVFAAIVLRIPVVVAESNAVPGAVHRIAARFAAACAVAWPDTPLPRSTVTGNPVRADLVGLDRSADARDLAREQLGVPVFRVVVAAFGGSLGATVLNRAIRGLATIWKDRDDVAIYHVVGKRDWKSPELRAQLPPDAALLYKAVEYENDMPALYAAADLAVCRAGATTSAELAITGLPAVLVPFPAATGDHQTANAWVLRDAGAALLLPDAECSGERLAELLEPLIADVQRVDAMSTAAKALAKPDAAKEIAALVEAVGARRHRAGVRG